MRSIFSCILTLLVALVCSQVQAQDAVSRNHYGKGVQAYNRGNVSSARQHFEQALNHGSRDPRVHYFLGLTKLRSGDTYGAESDFNAAATLEYTGKRKYNVGMALSRVQGGDRLQLERVRRVTRATIRSMPKTKAKPKQAPMPAPRVESNQYNEFNHAPLRDEAAGELPADDGSNEDPFKEDIGFGESDFGGGGNVDGGGVVSAVMRALFNAGGKAVPSPNVGVTLPGRMPAAAAGDDGFGMEDADEGFGDDLIGEDAAEDDLDVFGGDDMADDEPIMEDDADIDPFADDPMVDDSSDMEEDDLFGDDTPAEEPATDDGFGDDPFADDPEAEPAADDDPFGGDNDPFGEGEGGDDPFGEDPAGETPGSEDDPFGGDDDPFGL